jgi:hypothetical protein
MDEAALRLLQKFGSGVSTSKAYPLNAKGRRRMALRSGASFKGPERDFSSSGAA